MIVLLYGPDSYRRKERKNFYADQFEKKYGIPALYLDLAEEDGLKRLEEAARSRSLFDVKKLIIAENISEVPSKAALSVLKLFLEDKNANLLLSEDKKPLKALDILLKKPGIAEEFETLKGPSWLKFVKDEAKKSGVLADLSALNYMAEAYNGDSWSLATELRKLSALGKSLTRTDLEEMGLEIKKDYFPLVNGLRAGRIGARLWSLESILAMNEPAAKVFNILAALWVQRAGDFAEYDKAIKFGRMDYEEALLDLALS